MASQPEIAKQREAGKQGDSQWKTERTLEGVRREEGARGPGEWTAGPAVTAGMARQNPGGHSIRGSLQGQVRPLLARCRDIQTVRPSRHMATPSWKDRSPAQRCLPAQWKRYTEVTVN